MFARERVRGGGQTALCGRRSASPRAPPRTGGLAPGPGRVLIGDVVDVEERRGFAERPYPIVVVRTDEGKLVAFHAFHAVPKDELAKLRPQVGDRLGVGYHGLVEKGESRYELYRLKLVRAGGEPAGPDWDAIAGDAAKERDAHAVRGGAPTPAESPVEDEIPF